jgi:hypothetical protein
MQHGLVVTSVSGKPTDPIFKDEDRTDRLSLNISN